MRWQSLFDDLEAQLGAAEAAELAGEIADRYRTELARVRVADRFAAAAGAPVALAVPGAGLVRGSVVDAGEDWVLLAEGAGREALVPLRAVLSASGVPPAAAEPAADPGDARRRVAKALDLRWALRGLARDRATVAAVLVDGTVLSGTLDRVAADHVDLALHAPGELRRAGAVRDVRLVPLGAVALVRSAG
jgi:hypothetical protein